MEEYMEEYNMEHIFPQIDSVMMCKVAQVNEYGVRCEILENWGNNLEGELLFSQLTRKKLRTKPSKFINIGKIMPLKVIDINEDNNHISLSKIDVDEEDKKFCEEKYTKYKTLYNILYTISNKIDKKISMLYNTIINPLFNLDDEDSDSDDDSESQIFEKKWKHPLDILIEMMEEYNGFDKLNLNCEANILSELEETIKSKIQPKSVKIVKTLILNCYTLDGIGVIKNALLKGEKEAEKLGLKVEIYLDAPPRYMITCETFDIDRDNLLVQQICEKIRESIVENGGEFRLI